MTTVNLVNPFWGNDKFLYWRWTPIAAPGAPLETFTAAELVFASSAGGANLLASASSVTAPTAADIPNLYDGDTATFANSIGDTLRIPFNDAYVQAQFATPVSVAEVRITSRTTAAQYTPTMWALAGSQDGVTWVGRGIYTSTDYGVTETKTFAIGAPDQNGGRSGSRVWIWRDASAAGSRIRIRELVYATSAGGAQLATGGTPFGRNTNTSNPSSAFDGDLAAGNWTTATSADGPILGYYFASAPNPTHYRLTAASLDFPTDWGIYYLSNCADWVLADTVTGASGWTASETRTYAMDA